MKDYEERSYYDIQLTNKQIIVLFIAGLAILALVFFLGLMVGKSYSEAKIVQKDKPAETMVSELPPKETKPVPEQNTSKPKKEYEFYKLKEAEPQAPEKQPAIITPAEQEKPEKQGESSVVKQTQPPSKTIIESGKYFTLQVFALKDKNAVTKKENDFKKKGYSVNVISAGGLYKIRIGKFVNRDEADKFKKSFEQNEKLTAMIVPY
jgi:cell division protein FtsN